MADNVGIRDALTFARRFLRTTEVGIVHTLHAIVDALPGTIEADIAAILVDTTALAGTVAGTEIQADVLSVALPTVVVNGQNTVAVAGTAEALAGATTLLSIVTIKALIGNTGNIFVGDSGVDSTNGYVLAQGESVVISVADLATIFIDSATSGDGVSFVGS